VGFACLVQQAADLLQGSCHLILHHRKSEDHQATMFRPAWTTVRA
jgi:hypothetical protein